MDMQELTNYAASVIEAPGEPKVFKINGVPVVTVTAHIEDGEKYLSYERADGKKSTKHRGVMRGFTPADIAAIRVYVKRAYRAMNRQVGA